MSNRRNLLVFLLVALAGCVQGPRQPPPDVDLMPKTSNAPPPVALRLVTPPKPAPPHVAMAPTNHIEIVETWVPLDRWCASNGFAAPHRQPAPDAITYAFVSTNGTMVLKIGSQVAVWRGAQYDLGFAPELIDGHPFVHSLDIRKNFVPLLETTNRTNANHEIVIDPGHGGTDNGTKNVFNGHFEKEYTLDLAQRLKTLLVADGFTVWLTRTNDVYMALSNRVAFAEQHKADIFISLHFNSAFPDQEAAGLETYCLTPQGMPSNLTRSRDDSSLAFPNNNFDGENLQLAALLHRAVLKVNGHADRGVRRARFLGVLQGQNRPAILMEGGYLSNPHEAKRIAEPGYRQRVAVAMAEALTANSPGTMNLAKQLPDASITNNHSPSMTNQTESHEIEAQKKTVGQSE